MPANVNRPQLRSIRLFVEIDLLVPERGERCKCSPPTSKGKKISPNPEDPRFLFVSPILVDGDILAHKMLLLSAFVMLSTNVVTISDS